MTAQSNFQDVVAVVGSSLAISAEAVILGGDAGTKSYIFSNASAELDLAANPTANRTIWLPDAGGTVALLTNVIQIAAGTQTASSGTVSFANSNGITFGMSGSSQVTASADYVRSISAGTTNATGNQIVFSNGNGVTFGANGATITASVSPTGGAAIQGISAGTQLATSGTVVFSNSNGVTFGMSGSSVVTATVKPDFAYALFLAGI